MLNSTPLLIQTLSILLASTAFCGQVPVIVDVPGSIQRGKWPVTFGVPFPKQTLRKGMTVAVTADGIAIPAQSKPLATWTKENDDIRWLLVDFQVDAATARQTEYRLVFGEDALQATASPKLISKRNGDRLEIDTGVAKFVLRDRGDFTIESVDVGQESFVKEDRPISFLVTDHEGRTFKASGDSNPDGAVIEDEGPCRLGIKSEGWYRNEAGEKFCRHETRLEFFAGSGLVRVLHTWIFTGTSESHQIRDLDIELPLTITGERKATFGLYAEDALATHSSNLEHVTFVQDCKNRFELTCQFKNEQTGKLIAEGKKYAGWCDLSDARGGVTVALREAWQNYPNELEIEKNDLRIHLWPKHGRLLDFRTDALLWPYGEEGIKTIDGFFSSRKPPYKKSLAEIYNNAMGVAKTHELWLDFHSGPIVKERALEVACQASTPVLAMADPKWNAASSAIGPVHPFDPEQFPQVEQALDAMFDRFVYWRDHYMDFGWFDYQDVHCDARNDSYSHQVAGGRMAHLWRHWDSTHYGFPNAPWLLYYRSGKRKYLQFAEANTRHCMDIDRCHFGDEKSRYKGGHYYCDWSLIHWNRTTEDHINYDKLEYMLYSYYLRGNRRALSVMKDWAELSLRYYLSNENRPLRMIRPPKLENIRHYAPPLGNLTELYRVTWDERYLEAARNWSKALVEMHPKNDEDWKNLGALQFCWESMSNYVRLTGDPALKKVMASYAERSLQDVMRYGSLGDAAYGFEVTEDLKFLDLGKARLLEILSRTNTSTVVSRRGTAGSWAAGHHPYSMRTIPALLAGLANAPQTWRDRHLPLLETNQSFHMAGPRLPTIYLKGATKGPAKCHLWLGQNQAFTFKNGKGEPVQNVERVFPPRSNVIEWNPGEPGNEIHTLSFPLRQTRHAGDYIERGNVEFFGAENASIAVGPSTAEGHFCIFGPRFYFFVPEGIEQFEIEVDTQTTWALYGWHPVVSVFDPEGITVASREGPGEFTFTHKPNPAQTNKLWSLGPLGRVSAPMPNRSWVNPVRPFDSHFPAYFKLSKTLPQFVSPNPALFFVPTK
ncbi:MAG: hypothetical protein O3B01_07635 [Planctomycetota bacterium]|nr:hypothetical protein [Planctomycetota bacterium]